MPFLIICCFSDLSEVFLQLPLMGKPLLQHQIAYEEISMEGGGYPILPVVVKQQGHSEKSLRVILNRKWRKCELRTVLLEFLGNFQGSQVEFKCVNHFHRMILAFMNSCDGMRQLGFHLRDLDNWNWNFHINCGTLEELIIEEAESIYGNLARVFYKYPVLKAKAGKETRPEGESEDRELRRQSTPSFC
jgi:hypothetical protein